MIMPDPSEYLFGDPPPAPRITPYGSYDTCAPWNRLAELALWPLTLNCENRTVYEHRMTWVCQEMRREPHCLSRHYVERSQALIERRTITQTMNPTYDSTPDVVGMAFAETLLHEYRAGRPLSWAERVIYLPAYARKVKDKKPVIKISELLAILGRDTFDIKVIIPYLERVERIGVVDHEDPPLRIDYRALRNCLRRCMAYNHPKPWAELLKLTDGDKEDSDAGHDENDR